jgi:thioredoxin reductase
MSEADGTPAAASDSTAAVNEPALRIVDGEPEYDVVVIGGGPAGLSAALNLVRARKRTLVLDSNRPRHSATLVSHGFLTRDGVSPLDLRQLARDEVSGYAEAEIQFALVSSVEQEGEHFRVRASGVRGSADRDVTASRVVVTAGLAETLPRIQGIRSYYGTALHSCLECDGYDKRDQPLAMIGETDDLAERALLLTSWSDSVTAFTNGSDVALSVVGEETLLAAGVAVERRPIAEITGDRTGMTGITLDDGTALDIRAGFIRPVWTAPLDYLAALPLDRDDDGLVRIDSVGRTSLPGVYAAGDITPPGPQQLIVAAGAGAKVSAAILSDSIHAKR